MKLFEKQVFIALSSKEQNIKAGSHCNFMIFQWEPDLTFFKWSKNWKHGHSKQAPVAKKAEKCPKIAQTLHLKSENGPLRIYPLFLTTLDCFCGTLVGKTELKCTKNFKALNLNFTKRNGTGFWRFGTDMKEHKKLCQKYVSKVTLHFVWGHLSRKQTVSAYVV